MSRLRLLPWALIGLRVLVGLVLLLLAFLAGPPARWACVLLIAAGVLSDIFDGVVARRLGSVTAALRRWDGRADIVFWACSVAGAALLQPELRQPLVPMVATLVLLEALAPLVSFARFGQDASTHHVLSKLFGLGLWLLVSVWFAIGDVPSLRWTVFLLGVASELEAAAIMAVLPSWRADVPSLPAAMALRAQRRGPLRTQLETIAKGRR